MMNYTTTKEGDFINWEAITWEWTNKEHTEAKCYHKTFADKVSAYDYLETRWETGYVLSAALDRNIYPKEGWIEKNNHLFCIDPECLPRNTRLMHQE